MKKKLLSVVVLILSLSLALGLTGSAAGSPGASKEEVIYVRLDCKGEVKSAYVVNSFELSRAGQVTDYGDYSSVINLSTTEELDFKDGRVSIDAPAGRFNYQGELKSIELPWKIGVEYYLDGKTVNPEELAGKSGRLEIAVSVRKNEHAAEGFFESFALNVTVTLDADLCYEIRAEGGTVASAGGNRVVTFTLLPGREGDFAVSAWVRDFEMEAIQFAGLPMSINVDIDDSGLEELTGGLTELRGGIASASEGAAALSAGISELDFAAGELRSGMSSMQAGMREMLEGLNRLKEEGGALSEGAASLAEGIGSILAALGSFSVTTADLSELASASAGVNLGLGALSSGLAQLQAGFQSYRGAISGSGQDPSSLVAANGSAAAALRGYVEELEGRLSALAPGTQEHALLAARIEQLGQIIGLLGANSSVIASQQQFIDSLEEGVGSLASGSAELAESYSGLDSAIQSLPVLLSQLAGGFEQLESGLKEMEAAAGQLGAGVGEYAGAVASIAEGYKTLYDGFVKLSGGCGLLKDGLAGLSQGAEKLSDGLARMKNETSGIDGRVQEGIEELISGYTGRKFENVSFVSDKNRNIKSVQFVMLTPSIRQESREFSPPPEKDEGFLDRLLALFGFQ